MLILNDFNDIKSKINGEFESDKFEVKKDLITVEKLVKIILSFMNGEHENGYIIIGIPEKDGKANADDVVFPSFPQKIKIQEKDKDKKTTEFNNLQEYRKKVQTYLKNNIIPKIDALENFLEIKELEATNRNSEKGNIILIKVSKYKKSLVQYSYEQKFYARLPQKGANDYGSIPMDGKEISEKMKSRYYHEENLGRPIYYDAKPAVPELTTLFDLIYLGYTEKAEILLEQIPTLTQMIDSKGYNALQIAIAYKRKDIVSLLLNEPYKMSLYHRNNEGDTPLLTAAYVDNLEAVKDILERCPNSIHDKDRLGNNIFLKASCYGHVELLNYLAENYADKFKKTKNYEDYNVLKIAAYSPSLESIKFLLDKFTWEEDDLKVASKISAICKEESEKSVEKSITDRISNYENIETLLNEAQGKPKIGNLLQNLNSPVFVKNQPHKENIEQSLPQNVSEKNYK